MLDGFMVCPMCGSYLTVFTDLQTALFYQRLEGITHKMGLSVELSDYSSGDPRPEDKVTTDDW